MKACFINPPIQDFYSTSIRRQPLGLLYVLAAVRAAGFDAAFINGHSPQRRSLPLPEEFSYLQPYLHGASGLPAFPFKQYSHFGASWQEIERRIRDVDAGIFFIPFQFTPYHRESEAVVDMVRRVRPGAAVVAGGCHAALYPEQTLERGVDFVVTGEGEESSVQLLRELERGGGLSGVPGLAYRSAGSTAKNGRRYANDINALPLPARDALRDRDFKAYRRRAVSLITSRGCPNRCAFCTVRAVWGESFRARGVGSVLDEIAECGRRYGATMINFEDDNLFSTRERAVELLDGLIQHQDASGVRLDLTAMNGISLEHMDDDILNLMQRAGFKELNISLMTRSASLQQAHGRPFDSMRFARIARIARRLHMNVRAYFILGLPGQTAGEARDTIVFLRSLDVKIFPSVYYNVHAPQREWMMQRSSAFFNETEELSREDLITLFNECR